MGCAGTRKLAAREAGGSESRDASAANGAALSLDHSRPRASNIDLLWVAQRTARARFSLPTAFRGLVAGAMGLSSNPAAAAFLQQSITTLVFLLPADCCRLGPNSPHTK